MICHQSAGTKRPSMIVVAGGVCIQLLADEDPEGRDQRAERHHAGGEEVQARPTALQAEQHDAEEAGLEEEGGQHLVGQQRADDAAGEVARTGSSWCRTGRLITMPETTPMPKATAKIFSQNW